MSLLESISKFLFGDWTVVYIAIKDDVYDRSIKILKENNIKYKVQVKKGQPDQPLKTQNAYYIKTLRKDYQRSTDLLVQKYEPTI